MKRKSCGFVLLTVFGVTPAYGDYTLNSLVTFDRSNGSYPYAGLISDGSGNLYGTTFEGGAGTYGTVFKVAAGTNALTTLASFNQTNGSNPEAGLMSDAAGNLYGTTYEGGTTGGGTVFKVAAGTNTLTTLATFPLAFPYPSDGTNPQAVLMSDASGNLYGTTAYGGTKNLGTVFQVPAAGGPINTLATFVKTNGQNPVAGVISDAAGNLYGTTQEGGASNDGTVFRVSGATHALTTLVTFQGPNGANPNGSLISDAAGNLYGTTTYGGANSDGTVFEIPASGGPMITLTTFNGANGTGPRGALMLNAGILYGTTWKGGADDDGTVYKVPAAGGSITTLATFTASNGANPISGVMSDAVGNLYGTTWYGGNLTLNSGAGVGTVFKLSPQSAPAANSHAVVSAGAHQATGIVGGTSGGQVGAVAATFTSTTGGNFNVDYDPSLSLTDLSNGSQGIQAGLLNFALPTGFMLQAWDVSLDDGSFSGETQLVFYYDPTTITPGIDPSTLLIYHFDSSLNQWVVPSEELIDTTADTITLNTSSFSTFALGVGSVPEPNYSSLIGFAALTLMARRRLVRQAAMK